MNNLYMRKLGLIVFISLLSVGICNSQVLRKNTSKKAEKGLFGKSTGRKKEIKIKEPRKVLKAKRKQESNEKKIKRDYAQFIKKSQQRTYQIQTPEVQARMKQNQKDSAIRDRAKKKNAKTTSKKAARKYK